MVDHPEIEHPEIESLIRAAVHDYDDALAVGDARRATSWFAVAADDDDGANGPTAGQRWVSRFGPTGEQFGAEQIAAARAAQPATGPADRIHDDVVTLDTDTALHLAVLRRDGADIQRTQVWRRRADGWRIVHAHVSQRPAVAS